MRFSEMLSLLQEKYKIVFSDYSNHFTILEIEIIKNNFISWNSHTLYMGNISHAQNLPTLPVMLFNTENIDFESLLPKGSCWTTIEKKDVNSIFKSTNDILYNELKSDAILFKIAKFALHDKNISFLINTSASLIGNTLILVDSNMKILAHSTVFEITDKLWKDNIEHGYCPYEFIQKVRSNKEMIQWSKKGEESKVITLEGDSQPKLVTRITQKGHIIGSVVMIVNNSPINQTLIKQLPQIGKILFDTFYNGSEDGLNRSFYSTILYQLLSEDDISGTFDLLTISKSDFPKNMNVVVARFIKRVENRYLKRIVGIELENIFTDGYLVQYKNYIGMLVPSVSSKQREQLTKLATVENLNIGISWAFNDISDFKKYFNQAVASIKHAQNLGETNKVLDYTDYSFYDLLFKLSDKDSLLNYCHPSLKLLREYDKLNNTELYLTLKTYLNCNKIVGTTADALFLHRNSISYRINRILEITGLELDDINTVYSLVDSFRIATFLSSTSDIQ